jgi:hypothetical protein
MARFKKKIEAGIEAGPPIGTIMGHHEDLTGVPSLPGTWVACDGQTISDSESPLDGQTIPDLNTNGEFLRGKRGVSTGTAQAEETASHTHDIGHGHGDSFTTNVDGHTHGSGSKMGYIPTATSGTTRRIQFDFKVADGSSTAVDPGYNTADNHSHSVNGSVTAHSGNSAATGGSETRPLNCNVTWIIRIK